MGDAVDQTIEWRGPGYPRQRLRRLIVRTIARAEVIAPDGRRFSIRVVRLFWPPRGGTGIEIGTLLVESVQELPNLLGTRVVWRVSVEGEPRWFRLRPFIYGEEFRRPEDAQIRAREVAVGLLHGRNP